MRFLVDQNQSPTLVDHLQRAGHDAVRIKVLGVSRATDGEIMDRASSEGRIVLG